jgi:hypothetical protein
VYKPGKGAFYATGLEEDLKRRGITHLIFAGVTTEVGGPASQQLLPSVCCADAAAAAGGCPALVQALLWRSSCRPARAPLPRLPATGVRAVQHARGQRPRL